MQRQPNHTTHSPKTYECVAVDVNQQCARWVESENGLPLTKAEANILTFKIVAFMVFVFILKQIKKSFN